MAANLPEIGNGFDVKRSDENVHLARSLNHECLHNTLADLHLPCWALSTMIALFSLCVLHVFTDNLDFDNYILVATVLPS